MRPNDFFHEMPMGLREVSELRKQRRQMLHVPNHHRGDEIDAGFPSRVIDQGFVRKTVHEPEIVHDQDDLADDLGADHGIAETGEGYAVFPINQTPGRDEQEEGNEKENRRRNHREKFVFQRF
jgi:hypothetical protein